MTEKVVNVVVLGLGGQGVLTASSVIAEAAFRAGLDVKKTERKGMSQRGGSVRSDVRFGPKVLSPMAPDGEVHFLVALAPEQVPAGERLLGAGGLVIGPGDVDPTTLPNSASLNVALTGVLSAFLQIDEEDWLEAIRATLPPKHHESALEAFAVGRAAGVSRA